jgi:hypothetical protein
MNICEQHRKHRFPHCCIYSTVAQKRKLSVCCLCIPCRGNVFTESLPSNGHMRHSNNITSFHIFRIHRPQWICNNMLYKLRCRQSMFLWTSASWSRHKSGPRTETFPTRKFLRYPFIEEWGSFLSQFESEARNQRQLRLGKQHSD